MQVIDHNKSIMAIAAYERSLGPKVERLLAVRRELKDLAATSKKLSALSSAEIDGLDAVTRTWGAHLMIGTSLDFEDIGILEARTPEGMLDNARNLVERLRNYEELTFTVDALSEVEQKHDHAKAAHETALAGRIAMQLKQRDLQAAAADFQKELVKFRTVVRIALGTSHIDFQRLRVRNARPETEEVDESVPATAESSSNGDGSSVASVTASTNSTT